MDIIIEDAPVEVVPFSVRLAARHGTAADTETPAPPVAAMAAPEVVERRSFPRRPANQLEWVRGARLKAGPDVTLVDISSGGALVEATVQLRPGANSTLEIVSVASGIEIPFRILRCQVADITTGVRYRGACAFKQPFDLERIEELARTAMAEREAHPAGAPWQKVSVCLRDGAVQNGYTADFSPARGHFSLWPAMQAPASERALVPLTRVKSVVFAGDAGEGRGASQDSGRRVEVTFLDREVLRGMAVDYRAEAAGFFVVPASREATCDRVFVVASAVRSVRFP